MSLCLLLNVSKFWLHMLRSVCLFEWEVDKNWLSNSCVFYKKCYFFEMFFVLFSLSQRHSIFINIDVFYWIVLSALSLLTAVDYFRFPFCHSARCGVQSCHLKLWTSRAWRRFSERSSTIECCNFTR